jgi:predicted nucleotidyltransferase
MESEELSGMSVSLPIPVPNPELFKNKATNDVLQFLVNHRFMMFSLRTVADHVGHSQQTVRRAVNVLLNNELVVEKPEGNQRLVRINRERLSVPDDPILRIPQSEFQAPAKAAVDELTSRLDDVIGIVLYGSVVRGNTDRRSDIDLWVLTQGDRATNQRNANTIARELEEETFNGDRYVYDIDVETVQAIPTYTDDVREIVVSGIQLYRTDEFQLVEHLLLDEEDDNE